MLFLFFCQRGRYWDQKHNTAHIVLFSTNQILDYMLLIRNITFHFSWNLFCLIYVCKGNKQWMYIRSSATEFGLSVNIYLTSLLSISISCTIFSMLLYLLNISKFKNVNERMKFPLKINRAAFLFNMFLAGMLWQILILIEIHNHSYFSSNKMEHTVVLLCIYISGIIL